MVRRVLRLLSWLAAALMLLVSTVGAAAAAGPVENLGNPISDYFMLDAALGKDPATGKALLYGATYVVSNEGVYFVAINPENGEVVKQHHMPGSWGGYHIDAAPDGTAYMASLGSGRADLWVYDPATDSVRIAATPPESGWSFSFGVTVAPWNKVYMGVWPSGKVYEYDPNDGSLTDLGVVVPGNAYPKALIALPGRRLLVGSGAPANLTVIKLNTGEKTNVLPPEYAHYSFAYNVDRVDNDVLVSMVVPDNRLLRFNAVDMSFLGEVPAGAPGAWGMSILKEDNNRFLLNGYHAGTGQSGIWRHNLRNGDLQWLTDGGWNGTHMFWVDIDGERWATSIGVKGLWGRWNPATGAVVTRQLPLPGAATNITALQRGPDGKIYGGTYETNALFSWDPATDRLEVLGPVAKGRSGEILSMASAGGKLFIGSYTHAVLTVYDPTKPWRPGTGPDDNPRDLGSMGEEQYRPWEMVTGSDGRVYVATSAAYGVLGGALTAIDPATGAMESWRYLAGDQHLFALAAGVGEIYVGTTNYGDATTAPGAAALLVFDVATESKVYETVPVPGAARITNLATAPDGRVYGTADGQWFVFNPADRSVQQLGWFPLGWVNSLEEGPDGYLYGHTGGGLFRIDPADSSVSLLTNVGGGYYRTTTFDSEGRLYWSSGPALLRIRPE